MPAFNFKSIWRGLNFGSNATYRHANRKTPWITWVMTFVRKVPTTLMSPNEAGHLMPMNKTGNNDVKPSIRIT